MIQNTPSPPTKPQVAKKAPDRPLIGVECMRAARAARLLDISNKSVYQLSAERRLEVVRLGPRQTRVLKRSLERYVGRLLEEELERDY